MRLLMALSPFLIFIALDRLISVDAGLFAAAGTSAALLLIDSLLRRRRAKILELGTLILFSTVAAYVALSGTRWSVASVRLVVDIGLLLIVIGSMLIGQPFTIQYAREQLPDHLRHDPNFIGVNYIITAAWAAAFAVMVAVDTAWVLVPGFSPTIVLIVSCAAIFCAFRFPYWYGTGSTAIRAGQLTGLSASNTSTEPQAMRDTHPWPCSARKRAYRRHGD